MLYSIDENISNEKIIILCMMPSLKNSCLSGLEIILLGNVNIFILLDVFHAESRCFIKYG